MRHILKVSPWTSILLIGTSVGIEPDSGLALPCRDDHVTFSDADGAPARVP